MARPRDGGFSSVVTEGGLLPADLLGRIASGDSGVPGLDPADYHLPPRSKLNEAVSRSWNVLLAHWRAFAGARQKLTPTDPGTGVTREKWVLPLFQELGYGRLPLARSLEVAGKSFPISHRWREVPIHLVGCGIDLDKRTPGAVGAARNSPHSLVQDYLNRSEAALWGFVSNGLRLRLLRDSASLTRQAYVEFDFEAMMEGEAFSDFSLFWLVCHESRLEAEDTPDLWLERWSKLASDQGARALDVLRQGVEDAIRALGTGFLAHPDNERLRERLRSGELLPQDYYRELLRLVYRLIFLFVAEDRGLLLTPGSDEEAVRRYTRWYSTRRLRDLADKRRGTQHADLYASLRLVMEKLDNGFPELALPGLGSFLWSPAALLNLVEASLANRDLVEAVRALCFLEEDGVRRRVDYRNLGAEELGSVYEALLELHPKLDVGAAFFELSTAAGHERKKTGSYYTPTSLVEELLNSALDPVLEEAARAQDPEKAILALKVCDPAVGSGHFLIAAAHRIARRLASSRTGEDEPTPDAVRSALRDVVGHCLYGVDQNPMAVELCKVSLWLEAMNPGKPLSFLDHRIKLGNSLLGTNPSLIAGGIPDAAFEPLEGDEKEIVHGLKKANKQERGGQRLLFVSEALAFYGNLSSRAREVDEIEDNSLEAVRRKEETWREAESSPESQRAKLVADAWCAAFVWRKSKGSPQALTQDIFRRLQEDPEQVPVAIRHEIDEIATGYRFFHWHLAFPDVFYAANNGKTPENPTSGWCGGFDLLLGNPPWERVKLQEQEFFAERNPDVANAPNAAARKNRIELLRNDDPRLHEAYREALRQSEGESHLLRSSGRYPLCGRGDINTYAVFAENFKSLISTSGRAGIIVPTGIATDDTTKFFFQNLMETASLASLYDFQSGPGYFDSIAHGTYKFCLLTLGRGEKEPRFAFFLRDVSQLADEERIVTLTAQDIALLNPNTGTSPIFRSRRDAGLTKGIYRRVPVLASESEPHKNSWNVSFLSMFHMSSDSHLFRTRDQLEGEGYRLVGNVMTASDRWLPLYEAKMIDSFDHRHGTYAGAPRGKRPHMLPEAENELLGNPSYVPLPYYWVTELEVAERLERVNWRRGWLIGWRDVTDSTNSARTVVSTVIPRAAVSGKLPLLLPAGDALAGLVANLASFVFDYSSRQKIGGKSLSMFILRQLPIVPRTTYSQPCTWSPAENLEAWLRPRVLELAFTASDLAAFGADFEYHGPPFRWDPTRRFLLRCELDAAFFHLYGVPRDDVDYIMGTFPVVRRNDEKKYGDYRTRLGILEIYDRMQKAIDSGVPYQALLDPPPGDPRAAHPAV